MAKDKGKAGSLLAKKATGGEIAEHGFSFQEGMLLARLPVWLAQSGFSQLIREARGDAEARFFVPSRGDCREFNEFKDHRLTPSEFWPEIDDFLEMETAHPDAYRKFRLVCVGVNDDLRVVCRALDRARRALPFYDGVSSIEDSTFDELAERVMASSGRGRGFAEFVFKKVEVDYEAPSSTNAGFVVASFQAQLERELPECAALNGSQIRAAFVALGHVVKSKVAEPISRAELTATLREAIPGFEFPTLDRTRVYTSSESESAWDNRPELLLEWGRFSGHGAREFPGTDSWSEGLKDLIGVRDWILSSGAPRSIILQGTRRLSASVALGSVLSATAGFVIEVENREEFLATNQHADSETPAYEWLAEEGSAQHADEIAVVVSVKREIAADVASFLNDSVAVELCLHSDEAMTSAQQMNLAVENLKKELSEVLTNTGAKVVHLFLAVPGPFALFLGHRLNATRVIQCYEFVGPSNYVPAFRLPCM